VNHDATGTARWRRSTLPAARPSGAFSAVRTADGEVVLFDAERVTYHTLNGVAHAIWSRCDRSRSVTALRTLLREDGYDLSSEAIELGLLELHEAGLLEPDAGMAELVERRALVKAALAGVAGAVLLPAVSSVSAPVAAETESQCGESAFPVSGGQACADICQSQGFRCASCCDPVPTAPGCCCQCFTPPGFICVSACLNP
jgi:hypothetical protein